MLSQFNGDRPWVLALVTALGALICAVIGAALAASKGRRRDGLLCGLLLGPFGCVIAAMLEPSASVRKQRLLEQAEVLARATAASAGHDPQPVRSSGGPMRTCPWCAELVQPRATVCRYCRHDLESVPASTLAWNIPPDEITALTARYEGTFRDVLAEVESRDGAEQAGIDAAFLDTLCRAVLEGKAAEIDLDGLLDERAEAERSVHAAQDDRFTRFWADTTHR